MYSNSFQKFVTNSYNTKTYIGQGNPNTQILFIGKELSNENLDENKINVEYWKKEIDNQQRKTYDFHNEDLSKKEGHTWVKYQKLHNYIFPERKPRDKSYFNFQEKIFTTEISTISSKTTQKAKSNKNFKKQLQGRKKFFEKSIFIQSFPIVVLACWGYFVNVSSNPSEREIDRTFNVGFKEVCTTHHNGNEYNHYLHFDKSGQKLVIHCRQLSGSIPNSYLEAIGKSIGGHLQKIKNK